MSRAKLPPDAHAKQNRKGQMPRKNTQGDAVLQAVPTHIFIDTMSVYMTVAEKTQIEWKECQQWLCYLAQRNLIERIPKPNRLGRHKMQRRLPQVHEEKTQ